MVQAMMNKMTWREMSQTRQQQGFTGTGTGTSPARQPHGWMLQSGTTGRFRGTGRRLGRVGKRHGRMNHGHVGAGLAARQQAAQQAGICPSDCSTSVNPWTNVTTCNCATGTFSIYVIPKSRVRRPTWREMKAQRVQRAQQPSIMDAIAAQVPEQRVWECVARKSGGKLSKIGRARRACLAMERRRPSRRGRSAFRRR